MTWLRTAVALACAAPQSLAAQVIVDEVPEAPDAPPSPRVDPSTLDEKGLRAFISRRGHALAESEAAIGELRRRFGKSDAAEAFAQNAEATMALDRSDGPAALRGFKKVVASYSRSADPAVTAEVVRAMQGQAEAYDLIEAGDLLGPSEPVTADTIRLDVPSHRLRRDLVNRYGLRSEPEIRRVVARERANIALAEAIASRRTADPSAFVAIVRDYGSSADPDVQCVVADVLAYLARFEPDRRRQIGWHGEIIRRFSASRDFILRSKVGDAFSNKAYLQKELGEHEAARRTDAEFDQWSRSGL